MYTPNNIHFRIVSSKTLAQFKHDQSFDFAELVYNPKVKFGAESREVVLLNYEEWFNFLLLLEKYFISLNDKVNLTDKHAQYILDMMNATTSRINHVMTENPQHFGELARKVVENIGRPILVKHLFKGVSKMVGSNIYTAFPYVTTLISETLHQGLLALAEYEALDANATEAVLNCESYAFSVSASAPPSCELALAKAKQYKTEYGVNSFRVNDYTLDKETLNAVVRKLNDNGFSVSHIESKA
jgi:hypothetical protein